MQTTVFCQPSQLEATTNDHALISVDNSKHHSSAVCRLCEGGKIHVFSCNIDNPDPKSPYATSTFPIMHLLICPPNFYITFVFHFSWVLQPSQGKLKTMLMLNFGGQIRCLMWKMWKWRMNAFTTQRLVIEFPESTP